MTREKFYTISAEKRKKWDIKELLSYMNLLNNFVLRDIKLRYKQTFFGFLWVIIQPILTAGIFTLLFGKLAKLPSENIPYSLYVFSGMIPWFLFSKGVGKATESIIMDYQLITKIYFPRAFLPLSVCITSLFDLIFPFTLFVILMLFLSISITSKILFIPVLVLLTFILTISLGLFFSACCVYYRDFKNMVPFAIQLMQYLSPIGYSTKLIPEKYLLFFSLNPMVGIIDGFRWAFFNQISFPTISLTMSAIMTIFLLFFSLYFFKKMENYFADVI